MIYTNLFEIQKMVSLQNFHFKDTKLLSNYHDHLENNLQFLLVSYQMDSFWLFQFFLQTLNHCSALFLSFEKSWINAFCTFALRVSFFAVLGILSISLFLWLKWTARCTLSNTCPLFAITLQLSRYLKIVYRQSTCW